MNDDMEISGPPDRETPHPDSLGIVPIDWTSLWALDAPAEEWSIPQILPLGREGAIYGSAGVGKSLFAVDIALAKATGRSVLGAPPAAPVSIVYIDGEMTIEDLHERLIDLGYGAGDDLSHLHYFQLQAFAPLDKRQGGDQLMEIARQYRPEAVILDTMTALVEGEESSADTYRAFHRNTAQRLKAAGVSLLRIDHEGKDPSRGQRGSSAKGDEADVIWRITTSGAQLELKNTKRRVPYVASNVSITRQKQPLLSHVLAPTIALRGALETAHLLDALGVSLDATAAIAIRALKEADQGRRREVVLAALTLRRDRARESSGTNCATGNVETPKPATEPMANILRNEQAGMLSPVPGTNGNHLEPTPLPIGSWFPPSTEGTIDQGETPPIVSSDLLGARSAPRNN